MQLATLKTHPIIDVFFMFLIPEISIIYAEAFNSITTHKHLLFTHFQWLLAQAHMCIFPIINTILDVWMKPKGLTQKQTLRTRRQQYSWLLYIENAFFSVILDKKYSWIQFLDKVDNLKSLFKENKKLKIWRVSNTLSANQLHLNKWDDST